MDQKWTKRQNERPPESPEIDLRPFRNQVMIYESRHGPSGIIGVK